MKVRSQDLPGIVEKGGDEIRLYLFFGPDESGSAALARRVIQTFGDDVEKVEFTGSQLHADGALLADEAASMSLFGARRYLHVTASGEECLTAVLTLLEAENAVNPVLMRVDSITEKSRIAKAAIASPHAVACFSGYPDPGQLGAMVADMCREQGLEIERSLADRIAADAGFDRRLAQSEVEKLALYLDARPGDLKPVTQDVIARLGAPSDDDDMMPIIDCVLSGATENLDRELDRLEELGISEVGLLLALQRRTLQLAELAPRARAAGNIGRFVEGDPRVFSRDKRAIAAQLSCWPLNGLARLNERLLRLHRRMLGDSRSASLFLRRELVEIAHAAQRMAESGSR